MRGFLLSCLFYNLKSYKTEQDALFDPNYEGGESEQNVSLRKNEVDYVCFISNGRRKSVSLQEVASVYAVELNRKVVGKAEKLARNVVERQVNQGPFFVDFKTSLAKGEPQNTG